MSALLSLATSIDLIGWPGVVIGVGSDGVVHASNGRLETLVKTPVIGRPIMDLLDAESSARKWERLARMTRDDSEKRWELIFHGTSSLLEPRTFTAIVGESDASAVWLVEHPVDARLDSMAGEMASVNAELATTQRALFIERGRLAAALKELERSNAALDEFAHAASHDLKAPLRAIIDYMELLEADLGDRLEDESHDALKRVGVLAVKMRGMIDAVLEYARAGRATSAIDRIDSTAVIDEIVEFLAAPPEISIVIDRAMPVFEVARVPFEQVFRNLIANAIKYRRADGAKIQVSASGDGECWHFVVADNGPGISENQQGRIWRLFQTSRPKEGTGIGLALVKRLVDAHGGRVFVESEQGEGARFHVLWPKQPRPLARGEA